MLTSSETDKCQVSRTRKSGSHCPVPRYCRNDSSSPRRRRTADSSEDGKRPLSKLEIRLSLSLSSPLLTPSSSSQYSKFMAQSRQVKLGAFYKSYAATIAKPSPVGIPTKRANLALDGWAAGEELMRQPMRRGRDQERIAEILLEKEFPSSNFVSQDVQSLPRVCS